MISKLKMDKKCNLCGQSFECLGDEGKCWCKKLIIDKTRLEEISNFGEDCFCENCLSKLTKNGDLLSDHKIILQTKLGEFELEIKKIKTKFVILIHNNKFRYPLLTEEFEVQNETLKQFSEYRSKLENNEFKIIKNYEAVDKHYHRVFSRVKYGLLFK